VVVRQTIRAAFAQNVALRAPILGCWLKPHSERPDVVERNSPSLLRSPELARRLL
jgi:hypothetical protein